MDALSIVLLELQVVSYIKAGFLALLAYDTLLQINQEYLHIWRSRWTLIKCLYLWTRYTPFVATIFSLVHSTQMNPSACNTSTFTTIFSGFGIGITELVLMVRTYTLYERSKKLLLFFFLMWFSVGGVSFWAVTKWTSSSSSNVDTQGFASCYFSDSSGIGLGLVCYLSLLVGETVIVLLTLWKLCRKFFHHKSDLLTSLYRDGVWFYLAIPPFTITTVIVLFIAPIGLSDLADTPVYIMHAVLCCRLITHAREMAAEEDRRAWSSKKSVHFTSQANFGLSPDVVIDIGPEHTV
ncbi:hypothetical protein DFH07DRAFT_90202 [Mycena maculata]|uniref:DUF6533 domain-containing protein n=1 Tax=Mycena maculata TaxID=230809 RepID=A0AAD7I979_9AGAR|nr:hypothetical protein DFH07DRAFT_90202 [Mycena maculata]